MKQYDAIIIGFGKGGKTLAAKFAQRGWTIALIERSNKMYGGTCPNIGCIPTKFLIHKAKTYSCNKFRNFLEQASDYRQAINEKNALTQQLRDNNYNKLINTGYVTVYNGEASFVSTETVSVKTDKETIELQAKYIFIDTGSETVIPDITGAKESQFVYTSTSIMELTELPKHLVIIGGGYIGLEFASMYAEFGSKVTVLESGNHLIPREDRDIAYSVKESLERKGIVFKMNAKVQTVYDTANGATITYTDTQDNLPYHVEADAVLLATGRRPYTKGLNLSVAGITTNAQGAILTNDFLQTNVSNIYALGDVKGGPQFTYISLDDSRIILDHIFGNKTRKVSDRKIVAYSVFIDPPLSHVGINEEEALRKDLDVTVVKIPAADNQRIKTLGNTDGLMKAVIDKNTHKILGCTLFCEESNEIINLVTLVMRTQQDYTILRDSIYTHPSVSEALNDLFNF